MQSRDGIVISAHANQQGGLQQQIVAMFSNQCNPKDHPVQ